MRKIIHVDMDCFYAAVELKDKPELRGRPVAVGGSPESRSVILTANYEARKFKVRSAIPTSRAVRLCPELVLIRPNFERYREESRAIRAIFQRYTDRIEPLSLDEAYLDVSNSAHFGGSATRVAEAIRSAIFNERQLTASAGVAPNKFLAKVASDWKKPNGLFVIRPEDVNAFVLPLPVEKIRGVGVVTAAKMHRLGLVTCADIQRQSPLQLARWFGQWGGRLAELARGIDDRPVQAQSKRKSLSVENTFGEDVTSLATAKEKLLKLHVEFERRLERIPKAIRIGGWVVKLKYSDFKSTTHEMASTERPTIQNFEMLLERAWKRRGSPVRLLGVGVRLREDQEDEIAASGGQLEFPLLAEL